MQAQFAAMQCMAEGASVFTETIFRNRCMHVPARARMGAACRCAAHRGACGPAAGRRPGDGAIWTRFDEPDPRRALQAEGRRRSTASYHLDRGYERLEEKLQAVERGHRRRRRRLGPMWRPRMKPAQIRRSGTAVVPWCLREAGRSRRLIAAGHPLRWHRSHPLHGMLTLTAPGTAYRRRRHLLARQ